MTDDIYHWLDTGEGLFMRAYPDEGSEMARDDIVHIDLDSGVSLFDGKPFVNLQFKRVDGRSQSMQMRPVKAREIAAMLLESAEAAVQDACVFAFANENEVDKEAGAAMVQMIREYRTKFDEEDNA